MPDVLADILAAVESLRPKPDDPHHFACDDLTTYALAYHLRAEWRTGGNPLTLPGMEIRRDDTLPPGVVETRARDGRTLSRLTLPRA